MFADIGPTQNTNLVEVKNAEIQPCLWDRPDERREHLQQQERIRQNCYKNLHRVGFDPAKYCEK